LTGAALAMLLSVAALSACERRNAPSVPSKGAGTSAERAPADWRAGLPKGAPDKRGQPILIKDVPKLVGIQYFAATSRGMRQAAQELGNVTVQTDAPTEARIEWQIDFVANLLAGKPDFIAIASNDPLKIAPVLRKALEQGTRVVGYDADAAEDAREFFVNQATFADIAKALVDEMVRQTGPEAEVAIVTSSFSAPNQTRWIEEMRKYLSASYPKLNVVAILPSEEDQNLSFRATQTVLKSYPNVKGIFAISTVAFPGAAAAVKQAGKCGQIAVVGVSTPSQMRSYMKEGCIKSIVLWNVIDLGYATVYVARALADGVLQPGATEVPAGRLGRLQVRGSEVLLGPPLIFTPENIDRFDF
jgi:ABC-type sugar transport system substrate-binding protein